jgi:hypothetical protein
MAQYLNFQDMIDGGGAGRSGESFEGGPFSGLLNAIGIKPAGYRERMSAERPSAVSRGITNSGPITRTVLPEVGALSGPAGMPVAPGLLALTAQPMAGPAGMSAMPQKQYSGRGYVGMPMMPQKQYSGRGHVGMPMESFANTPEEMGVLDYLRWYWGG